MFSLRKKKKAKSADVPQRKFYVGGRYATRTTQLKAYPARYDR